MALKGSRRRNTTSLYLIESRQAERILAEARKQKKLASRMRKRRLNLLKISLAGWFRFGNKAEIVAEFTRCQRGNVFVRGGSKPAPFSGHFVASSPSSTNRRLGRPRVFSAERQNAKSAAPSKSRRGVTEFRCCAEGCATRLRN
jgi:hypothetical protein